MRSQNSKSLIILLLGVMVLVSPIAVTTATAADDTATLRGSAINTEPSAPMMNKQEVRELRTVRSYPEQPPIIPHSIRGYQVDKKANKCLSCHSRKSVERSQAVMISVTHFVDRSGQVGATISPRRYFCLQCHVQQDTVQLKLGNTFKDVDEVIQPQGGE